MSFLLPDQIKYSKTGVRAKEVPALSRKYGSNRITRKPRKTFWRQYLSAFGDPIIKILLAALALNLIIAIRNANVYEPLGIAIALFLATFVSTLSEYGSESAFLKLENKTDSITCRVIRDGKLHSVNISELVVGDTVLVSGGDRIAADGIIVSGSVLVDESALSGESREIRKTDGAPGDKWDISSKHQLFRGSVVTEGECLMCVGRTGDSTLYGTVASEIQEASGKSPLTERLSVLAGALAKIGYVCATLVFFADLFDALLLDNAFDMNAVKAELISPAQMTSNILHALTLAITVVVVAVPEGLPMMITVVLSSNMQRLKRDNVLVRRLVGIETGGSVNILFCDKTGTLTRGKLSVIGFYDTSGNCHKRLPARSCEDVINCCNLCNESMMADGKPVGGNATDRALLDFAFDRNVKNKKIISRIPFDSTKKYSAVKSDSGWYVKGAPEIIFSKCKSVPDSIRSTLKRLTFDGTRVIALAKSADMQNYTLLGLIAISDKLRPDVRRSVKTVQNAGIQVCMVTGDNAQTAQTIAAACGIFRQGDVSLTSDMLSKMSDEQIIEILPRLRVVARALPSDKSRLVRLSKKAGLTCAMTGDGINDAPALKQADVGFAMGSGTEVAKQAGDIVVLDDNFTSISKAILYGRTIFKSIRKFIVFQLTMNLCAVGISIIGPFIGVDTPVTVLQMLWINIIMDTLAGLAFAGEPPRARYMSEKPLKRTEPVLNLPMSAHIFVMGGYSLLLCTLFLSLDFFKTRFGFYEDPLSFMTAFFALFVFGGVFSALCARSEGRNLLSGISKNRSFILIFAVIFAVQTFILYNGGELFRTGGLTVANFVQVLLLSATVIPVDFLYKSFKKH